MAWILGVSKNTVKKYLVSQDLERPLGIRDRQLEELFPHIVQELRRVGVIRHLLWEEYVSKYPDGFSYRQFCRKLAAYKRQLNVTIRIDHRAAEVMSVYYMGKKVAYLDPHGKKNTISTKAINT